MRLLILIFLIPVALSAQNLKSGGKLKPVQANMDIKHYTLSLDVDPVSQTINGFTEIDLTLTNPTKDILFDLWHEYTISKVTVNGQATPFKLTPEDLVEITLAKEISGKVKVKIEYGGKPAVATNAPWTGGFQWAKDSKGNPWIAITCQGEGGKIFFPCKDHPSDEPDEGADLWLTVPKGLTPVGPGLLIGQTSKGNKSTFHWKTNYPISNYCLVFNIGKYAKVSKTFTTVSGNKVPMEFYVTEENSSKAMYELELMERSAQIFEKYFGEYPWVKERIGLCETPHLGMEHQSNIAYGNKFKYTQIGGKDFDWLLTHEFGHEWWANKVTNKDWAHMWIQEGICSFGDALHYRELGGEEAYQEWMQRTARSTQNKLPIVQGDEIDSDQAYQGDIYGKGAFFMHTLRYVIGDEIFFPTLKKLATDPQYTGINTVVTDDVQKLFSDASGEDLKPLFDLFLRSANKLEIFVKQTDKESYTIQVKNLAMTIPMEIQTSEGVQKFNFDDKKVTVKSATIPVIDPKVFYLKRVILE
jgi:aminopeptidase N